MMRAIDVSDIGRIHAIELSVFDKEEAYGSATIASFCKKRRGYICGDVGYILFCHCDCEDDAAQSERVLTIASLAVTPGAQGQGLGRLLMTTVMDRFPSEDLYLHVKCTNQRALSLYLSLGFRILKTIPCYYRDAEDAYYLVHEAAPTSGSNNNRVANEAIDDVCCGLELLNL